MVYIRKARLLGSDSLLIIFCQKKRLFGEGDGLPKEKAHFTLQELATEQTTKCSMPCVEKAQED